MIGLLLAGGLLGILYQRTKKSMEVPVASPVGDGYQLFGGDGGISSTLFQYSKNSYRGVGAFDNGVHQQNTPEFATGSPGERLATIQQHYKDTVNTGIKKALWTVSGPNHLQTARSSINHLNEKMDPSVLNGVRMTRTQFPGTTAPSTRMDPHQIGTKGDPPHPWNYKDQ